VYHVPSCVSVLFDLFDCLSLDLELYLVLFNVRWCVMYLSLL
jgi:hypothetical protein